MADAAPERTREGEILVGRYRLEKLLGTGGMGEVYRARNDKTGRTVAIKVLRPEWVSNPEIVARFLREAHAANMVRHPNVVEVLDVGQDESGAPFIVQEFLEGRDLSKHLDEVGGSLTAAAAVQLILPVLDAIGFAHEKGVIHRDLKPENVFLVRADGGIVPKVLDFGISKIAGPENVRMTATGVAMGTPLYMSPEQIQGARDVDARADVWSLGVMLFEMLAHALPFDGKTQGDLFVKICTEDAPDLHEMAPRVPDALARVVMRCLRRNPAERLSDAGELAREIRNVLTGLDATALAITPPAVAVRPSTSRGATEAATVASRARAAPPSSLERDSPDAIEPAPASRRGTVHRTRSSTAGRSETLAFLGPGFLLLLGVCGLALVAMRAGVVGPWSPMTWWDRHAADLSTLTFTSVAVGLLIAAAAVILQVLQNSPPSLGLVLCAAGLIVEGYFLVRAATAGSFAGAMMDPTVRKFFPLLAPWAVAAVPAGLGLFGLGRAMDAWKYRARGGPLVAVVALGLALVSLFTAVQITRGVLGPHPASVLESDHGGDENNSPPRGDRAGPSESGGSRARTGRGSGHR